MWKHQIQNVKVQLVLVHPFDGARAAAAVFHSRDREVNMRNLMCSSGKAGGSRSASTGRDGVCTPSWARSQPDRLLGVQRVSEFGGLMFACRCQESPQPLQPNQYLKRWKIPLTVDGFVLFYRINGLVLVDRSDTELQS